MLERSKRLNQGPYWPLWGLHFGFHMVVGLLASIAGFVVFFTQGEAINGLALVGAGSFAIINSCWGFKELVESKVHKRDMNLTGNNR